MLDAAELRQLEPSLAPIFPRAVFYPDTAQSVNNFRFVQVLADALQRHGGRSLRAEVLDFDLDANGNVAAVETDAGREPCDAVVVAAGAWSRPLARRLGANPPLETERGYHLTIGDPGVMPRIPFGSNRRGFSCTPLEHGLRIAGTVELADLEAAPDWRRADVLMTHVRRLLPGVQDRETTRWMGHRPGLPDSVPVISPSPLSPQRLLRIRPRPLRAVPRRAHRAARHGAGSGTRPRHRHDALPYRSLPDAGTMRAETLHSGLDGAQRERFARDGFLFPIRILSRDAANAGT